MSWKSLFILLLVFAMTGLPPSRASYAEEEVTIEEDEAAPAATPAAGAKAPAPTPAAKAAPPAAAAPKAAAPAKKAGSTAKSTVILRVRVVPEGGKLAVRIEGKGSLAASVFEIPDENKVVIDFSNARYSAAKIILGAPGLGDIRKVRGAQFKPAPNGTARVVVELAKKVAYAESKKPGVFSLVFDTAAVAGPDEEPAAAVPAKAPAGKGPAARPPIEVKEELQPAKSGAGRSRLLHAMVTDQPDRVRLVATADGVVRYKLASAEGGRVLVVSLYDMDLKWSPPKLDLKEGPIASVKAESVGKPSGQVRLNIRLRQAFPYHVHRDQNQVVIEVEKETGKEDANASKVQRADLYHRITINVQNEDLASLIKALSFEAGFENVVIHGPSVWGVMPVTISLRDVPFAKALNLILAPNDLIWKVERNVLKVARASVFQREMSAAAVSGGSSDMGDEGGLVTRVFRLRYISVFELSAVGGSVVGMPGQGTMSNVSPGMVSPSGQISAPPTRSEVANIINDLLADKVNGKVVIDTRTNSLVVTDAASNMRKVERIIRELDVPLPQVMIEARLVNLRTTKSKSFGVEWKAEGTTPANPTVSAEYQNLVRTNAILKTGFLGPGFNIDATLTALETNGDAKVLLHPRIATIHDRGASISAQDTIPYRTVRTETYGNATYTVTTIDQMAVPITLYVRPHVNPNDTIGLEVHIISTAVTGEAEADLVPPTTQQTAFTQLIVRNGETAVIGGLLRDQSTRSIDKIPLLGDLPWFLGGGFFRREKAGMEKVELVLFLTPRVAKDI